MNNSKKIISSKIEMIKNGIVPAFNGHELVEMLESMTYEDRKIAKRKFRKLWRKFVKSNPEYAHILGYGNKNPSKANMKNRIAAVKKEFLKSG